ncbi:hypothetical protein MUO93_09760 [Candidatus Bathyarchaeota archaeon]|nr:hypothetical protein [Candidatus Bathyarchaeota archaeon]
MDSEGKIMVDVSGAWVEALIKGFIASPENNMGHESREPAWAEPLVGFSSGADPLYEFYKEDIGVFYVQPVEFFRHAFPCVPAEASDLTVISWILPQTEATKSDHRKEIQWPSERWARTRVFGEGVNDKLRRHLVARLADVGVESVAPMLSPRWARKTSEKYGYASTWSERHAAYAAGLGTFGLSDGLITPGGKAHRCGSVIARSRIEPTPRPYEDHNAYCLFYANGTCGACIKRCPAGAISPKGHDKVKCSAYVDKMHEYVGAHYGFKGYGCGFCQTGVPCESMIPEGLEKR